MMLRDVTFGYGKEPLLRDFSLELDPAATTGILGPNGSGKTTLLNIMAGLIKPWSGSVLLSGSSLAVDPIRLARQRAVLTQKYDGSLRIRVRDFLSYGRFAYDESDRISFALVDEYLKLFGLTFAAGRYFHQLSGGEQQMVRLIRSLVQLDNESKEKWLLLDEPTKGLDPGMQTRLLRQVKGKVQSSVSIVGVFHEIHLAQMFCEQVVLLQYGRIFAQGAKEDVLTRENLQKLYKADFEETVSGLFLPV